jgi:uncharacterized SAM-binding protein YcdF (DUF218 family)
MLTTREEFIILVDNDTIKPSDVIVLLEGDGLFRVKKAVELYHENYSKKILFSGGIYDPNYGSFPKEYIIPELLKGGVPMEDIIIEGNSLNTRDEAIEIMGLCRKNSWKRLILVASHYHQYRAYLTFLKAMQNSGMMIEIINGTSQSLKWFEETGWGNRFDLLKQEFIRIKKYRELGDLATYEEAIEYQRWKEKQV